MSCKTKDPKQVYIVIDGTPIPQDEIMAYTEVTPESEKVTLVNGIGGYEYQEQYNNDEKVILKLFKKDYAYDLMVKYNDRQCVNLYIKDLNTQLAYSKPDARISNIDSFTLGEAAEFTVTFLTPGLNIAKF